MGQPVHLDFEVLSALADGELGGSARSLAMEHLAGCPSCSRELEGIAHVDALLREPAAIGCEAALPLLSALIDHEADPAEVAVARAHQAQCAACTRTVAAWSSADMRLRALAPASPSARVDRAIAELVGASPRQVGIRLGLPRVAFAAVAAALLLVGSFYRALPGGAPVGATSDDRVLVAAVQQVVFNARENTLYVLDAPAAAVDARDASTNLVKVRIDVGGRPTALALNESANTILVLDSSQKKLTEIDASSNKILGSSTFATSGTPTAVSVDPTTSKIVVTAAGTSTTSASVAVLDPTTKEVESVRDVSVGAVAMVFDSSGDRALFVSPAQTTVVDANYKIITTLPGGVSAAFAQGDDRIAILSTNGVKSMITYAGPRAPLSLELPGVARAITAVPDGGFLVLVELGGKSRVSYVAPDGHEAANTDVAALGQDLAYDAKTRRFSVIGRAGVVSADLPTGLVAAASPSPSSAPVASPSSATSASPSASPSAAPSASAAPSGSPSPDILATAPSAGPAFVHLALPGDRTALLVSRSADTLWVLDDRNGVVAVDTKTARMTFVALLPKSAQIAYFAAGRDYVYAVDAHAGVLHVINRVGGDTSTNAMHFIKPVSSVAVGVDDRLWIGLSDSAYLLAFDPRTRNMNSYDLVNAHIAKLAVDQAGRILYSDDVRSVVGTYDPVNARLSEVPLSRRGVTTGLVVDGAGALWLSTSTGEVHRIRNKAAQLVLTLPRPITSLALDADGRAWYLTPLPSAGVGYGYATADGLESGPAVGGTVSSLDFAQGRAWLADPSGGLYVTRGTE